MQKRYHRVPQFLLRRFSERLSKNWGWIGYVSIEEKRPARGRIKELAQSLDFYSPEGEKALGNIERSIGWILHHKASSFSIGDFNNLALYVITQDIRTSILHSQQMERPQFWIEFLLRPDLADKSEQDLINELLKRCSDLEIMSQAFGPDLQQLNKVLLLNKTDIGFITSDVAVGFSNKLLYFSQGWRMNNNSTYLLSGPGVLWFFPISKDRCLLFYNKHTYSMNDRNNELSIRRRQDVRDINRCLLETGTDRVMFFENIYYDLRCMDFSYEDHVLKGSNLLNEAVVDMPIERIISPAFSFLLVRREMKDLQTRLYKETGNGNDLAINYSKMADRYPELFRYPQPPQGGMYD